MDMIFAKTPKSSFLGHFLDFLSSLIPSEFVFKNWNSLLYDI